MACVYAFRLYNELLNEYEVQAYKATLQVIDLELGWAVVRTQEDVPETSVIDGKYYLPALA